MKKVLLISLIVIPVILAAAWFEPTFTVRGWARGDAFFAGRSATYWRQNLASENPVDQSQIPQRLQAGGADAIPVLTELLGASEPVVRWQAADLSGKIGAAAKSIRPKLAAALKDPDPHVRSVAARALSEIPSENAPAAGEVEGLTEMLATSEKLAAIRTLAKYRSAAAPAVPDLIHLLTADDPTIRWNAAKTLGKIGPVAKHAIPNLIRALNDPDALVREHAAEALGDHGPDAAEAVPNLVAAMSDPAPKVRRDAVRSLGQIGPTAKTALPAIEKMLADREAIVREAAATAKRRIAADTP